MSEIISLECLISLTITMTSLTRKIFI